MESIDILSLFKKMEEMYSPESWKKFYKPKLDCFFFQHEKGAPIESITSHSVKKYLDTFKPDSPKKLNYFNALNAFYAIAYEQTRTPNIMQDVERPIVIRKPKEYMIEDHVKVIQEFIENANNRLIDRLLLGLALYTGLPRRYIFDLQNGEIKLGDNARYFISIANEDGDHRIPISQKLNEVIKIYLDETKDLSSHCKVFNYSQAPTMSSRVSTITKKLTGKSYSMNIIGNTFIKIALTKNPDVYSISKISLKSITTIEQHLTQIIDVKLFERQTEIVDSI